MFVCWQHPSSFWHKNPLGIWLLQLHLSEYNIWVLLYNANIDYTLVNYTFHSSYSGCACLLPLLPSCKWGYPNASAVHLYKVSAVLENESALKIVGCHHDTSQWYMGTVLCGGFLDTPMYIMIHDCWECSWNGFGTTTFCRHLLCYTQLCAHLYHAVTDQLQMLLCIPVNNYHVCTWRLGWKPQNGYSGCSQGEETVVMRSLFWY